jgi:multidrug resistance efflux pump
MVSANLAITAETTIDGVVTSFARPDRDKPATAAAPTKGWIAAHRGQALRVGIGAALLAAGGALYAPDILYTTSSEAVLNARTISIAAPIDGRVAIAPPAEGTAVAAGAPLLTIDNPVVDRGRLGELQSQRTEIAADLAAARQLAETLKQQLATLTDQASEYRQSTVNRLDIKTREAQAELQAAQASAADARKVLERKSVLAADGWAAAADLDRAAAASSRAYAAAARAQLAVRRLGDEAEAARRGVFIADNGDGAPYAQQRIDEFHLRLAEAEARAAGLAARQAQLDDQLAAERTRVAQLASADLRAPASGVVWRPEVAAGAAVARDRQVLTLIDCSTLYVTASFGSRQFDNLRPGAQATVRVADSGKEYPGTVVDVRALRGAGDDHFAAPLPALGAHQVMALLRLDDSGAMAGEKYCNVGRRVDVRFTDLSPVKAATNVR